MLQVKLREPNLRTCRVVPLTRGRFAIIDVFDLPLVSNFTWFVSYLHFRPYAVTYVDTPKGRRRLPMHRLLTGAGIGETVHHGNKDTLDNRQGNMMKMMKRHHAELHKIRRFGRNHDNRRL